MTTQSQSLDAIQDIKRIMERSGRFISLSGWSGIIAGLCGLVGAAIAASKLAAFNAGAYGEDSAGNRVHTAEWDRLVNEFYILAAVIFVAALVSAFIFTYLRSRKEGIAIWGKSAVRLLWNVLLPMAVGGFFVLRLLSLENYVLIAPACLIFYGLALVNASKYTLGEVRYLGYSQLMLGLISLWLPGSGLICWALGFGVMHIIYGVTMWWKYERKQ